MKKLIVLLLLPSLGCAWSHRHPTATKVVLISAGAVTGGAIAYATRRGTCPTTINGYHYEGTPPCPNPATYDPGFRRK